MVPTYKMTLADAEKPAEVVATYNVTRDSWYSRGIKPIDDSWTSAFGIFEDDEYALTNRAFEPADANVNLYTGIPLVYPPNSGLEAFVITQYGKKELNAEPFTKEQNTHLDGRSVDDARSKLDKATGVMIHIGGYYDNQGKQSVAASYGCFGFVCTSQIYENEEDAQKQIDDNNIPNSQTSNSEYNTYMNNVVRVRNNSQGANKVLITIESRSNVEKAKSYTDDD